MKKALFTIMLFLTSVTACSCKANWFGDTVDVPWYFIVIPTALFIIAVISVAYIVIISKTYVCPECKTEFKPKWYHFSVCIHFNGKRIVKCPKCGRKGFCERKR